MGKLRKHKQSGNIIEDVVVKVEALRDGYVGGRIRKEGDIFVYEGEAVNGLLPSWVKCLDDDFVSEFAKRNPEGFEKAASIREEKAKLEEDGPRFETISDDEDLKADSELKEMFDEGAKEVVPEKQNPFPSDSEANSYI